MKEASKDELQIRGQAVGDKNRTFPLKSNSDIRFDQMSLLDVDLTWSVCHRSAVTKSRAVFGVWN